MKDSFFKDLKIIELASVLAGPAVGMFFAELGAEVIKIENKLTNGDVTRTWKLASEDNKSPISAYYASVNWNKKSLFYDLTDTPDKEKIYDLIKNADIVISSYKHGDDEKLGMDYTTLKRINPALIYTRITGFENGSSRTAYDLVLQAETGFMHMNGTAGSGPLKMPVALIDILAAHQLKEGILVALIKKLNTGKGSCVSVSLFDSAVASLANQAGNWLMANHDPQPLGSIHPNIAPYGETYTTADNKQVVLAIGNNKQFEKLCAVLNIPNIISDPHYSTNTERVKNRGRLSELIQIVISKLNSTELMRVFIKNDIPAGLIKSVKEVFENKNAEALVLSENYPGSGMSKRVKTAIFNISD